MGGGGQKLQAVKEESMGVGVAARGWEGHIYSQRLGFRPRHFLPGGHEAP